MAGLWRDYVRNSDMYVRRVQVCSWFRHVCVVWTKAVTDCDLKMMVREAWRVRKTWCFFLQRLGWYV